MNNKFTILNNNSLHTKNVIKTKYKILDLAFNYPIFMIDKYTILCNDSKIFDKLNKLFNNLSNNSKSIDNLT